ncbi:MAG: DUF2304 domain-containing protein [Proteobacteria bacterium]|nr:DUF2304 domain-containing protein [Pseudomonadota bacterium]
MTCNYLAIGINLHLQIFSLIIAIAIFITILNLIRKEYLEIRYSIVWLVIISSIVVVTIYPKILCFIANILGIGLVVNTLFFISLIVIMMLVFGLTLHFSKQARAIRKLTQRIAILEQEITKLNERSRN